MLQSIRALGLRKARDSLQARLRMPYELHRAASAIAPQAEDIPAIFDIFDAPARLGEGLSQSLLPKDAGHRSGTFKEPMVQKTRQSPYAQPTPLLFDGPARPRKRFVVNTRSRPASTSSVQIVNALPYKEPKPITFDGPSRPRRRSHTQFQKTNPYKVYFVALIGLTGCSTYFFLPGA